MQDRLQILSKPTPPRQQRPAPGAQAATLTPKDIYAIIRRHMLLIVILTVLGAIGGGASWQLLLRFAPKYTARTYVRVLPPVQQDPMDIRSAIVNKDLQYQNRQSIAQLIKQQNRLDDLIQRDKVKETEWFKSFGSEQNKSRRRAKAIGDLEDNLGASAMRDAEYIVISMTCGDAEESALIVNQMVDLFMDTREQSTKTDVGDKLVQLTNRRGIIEDELAAAERALAEVRSTFGFSDLEERSFEHTITLKLNAVTEEEDELKLVISQLQASIGTLEEQTRGDIGVQTKVAVERDPTLSMLTQAIASRNNQLAAMTTKFGENHRTVRQIRKLIDDLDERKLVRQIEIGEMTRQANLRNAQDQFVLVGKRLEEAQKQRQAAQEQKKQLDVARVEYQRRSRIRDQFQDNLAEIKELIGKQKIIREDPETAKVMRIGPAPKPLKVSSPLWYVHIPGGTFLGGMLAVGLAFLIELLNDLLRTPRDVVRYINAPLLGVVPHADEDHQTRGVDLCHVVRLAPYSIVSEAYRHLQINLKLSREVDANRVLLLSSCGAGDGKTSVAINLATSLVAEGKSVLIIDTNFWRSMLHKAFPVSGLSDRCDEKAVSNFGLSNLLRGECQPQDAIRKSGLDNFDIIDSGPTPANPTELLASASTKQLLEQMRLQYDYVIVDGPPILLVSAARILTGYVDGSILVLNANQTRRGAAQRAVREMREINANLVGCVLMAVRALKGGYFHEQYKSFTEYQIAPQPVA